MMPVYKDDRFGAITLPSRFWAKVLRTPSCWLWTAAKAPQGYGRFNMNRKLDGAHRTVLGLHGVKTPGFVPDHLCEIRNCVHFDHLDFVSHGENLRRAAEKRGQVSHCKYGHEYTPDNTTKIKGSIRRNCRQCVNARYAKRKLTPGRTSDE